MKTVTADAAILESVFCCPPRILSNLKENYCFFYGHISIYLSHRLCQELRLTVYGIIFRRIGINSEI